MYTLDIVIVSEAIQFALQIGGIPEQDGIQEFEAYRADQSFHEGMRERNVKNCFDLFNLEDTKVRLPLVIGEERVVIGAQILGDTLLRNGVVEHAAKRSAIDVAGLDAEADDPPGELIHNNQNPMGLEADRLAAKQINASEAVFGVASDRQPGRSCATTGLWVVVFCQYPPHDILIDLDPKGIRDLLSDSRAAEARVAPFHLNDGMDQFLVESGMRPAVAVSTENSRL